MIKSNQQLFNLIQSLSVGEKKHFYRFAGRHVIGEQNLYVDLFRAMDRQEVYQESELKEMWGDDQPERRLPVAKNYLLGLVLESLRRQHRGKTVSMYLREQIDYVELLFQKGQGDLGLRWLKKAKKKAEVLDEPLVELELIRWEKKLVRWRSGDRIAERLEAIVEEEMACLERVQQLTLLQGIRDQFFGLIIGRMNARDPGVKAKMEKWISHPLVQAPPGSLGGEARLAWHFIQVYYAQLNGDAASMLEHYRDMFTLWEDWPEKQKWEAQRYITTLYLYLDSSYA